MPSTTSSQPTNAPPRVFYVSYDGMGEPLGRSQVLAYLRRLAPSYEITLFSFEKSQPSDALRHELAGAGIDWHPLPYHRTPPVLSTMRDVMAGRRALVMAAKEGNPAIVHVRSYVPALMALLGWPRTDAKLLFDIRGFWADERVEGGLWRRGGGLYRLAKRCERWFFSRADAIVTLTQASVPQIREWTAGRDVRIEVIPTCVQADPFLARPSRPDGPHVVWVGSVGTWYRFDLAANLSHALRIPLTVLTRQEQVAREILQGYPPADVASVEPEDLPDRLFAADIGLCLIKSSFSKLASAPTRFAEYLAAGMPVVVSRGVGDLEAIVETHNVGVVLHGDSSEQILAAAAAVRRMTNDPQVVERCRRVAREQFDVELGAKRYDALYRDLLVGAAVSTTKTRRLA